MTNTHDIQKRISDLFASQNFAVLSTQKNAQPYASLVAFVSTEDLRYLYFVTPKTTRKFANLTANPGVAFLISNNTNQNADVQQAIAVTVEGQAGEITGPVREQLLPLFLAKHPDLAEFAKSPDSALVQVTASSYYLVENFQNVMTFHPDS